MDNFDLLSLGQHCSVPDCRQRDFLPFQCDCCNKLYCLEHRTYSRHDCQKADARTPTTIICPLCARAIKIAPSENPNLVFEEHTKQGCDPSNYSKVMRKRKCPVAGCKEKLTSINTYSCKHCAESVCLKHRFPEDHACARKPQPGVKQQPGAMASLRRLFNFDSESTMARAQQRPVQKATSQSAAPSRAAIQDRQIEARGQQAAAASSGSGSEVCPVCGSRFHSLSDLIAHSAVHNAGLSNPEICPHCQASFADAVQLVEHVERRHNSGTACVLS